VWAASVAAVEALKQRQSIIDRLPVLMAPTAAASAPAAASGTAIPVPASRAEQSRSQISVQSVLAVAGAGLFAVAAVVFTFLNPDLTNFDTRTAIIAVTTAIFLGGAWLLARARLQFSAEAVGALGMVFVVLDIWAFSTLAPIEVSPWIFGGIGTLLASSAMVLVAALARIRIWFWAGLVGLAITPAFFGYAQDNSWSPILGHLAVGLAALGTHEIARRLAARFGNALRAEHITATLIQALVVAVVLGQLVVLPDPRSTALALSTAGIIAALAVIAALGTRYLATPFWSFLAGVLSITAVALLPFALMLDAPAWLVALVPLAAAIGIAGLAAVRKLGTVSRRPLLSGAWMILFFAAVPASAIAALQILGPLFGLVSSGGYGEYGSTSLGDYDQGLASVLGLAAVSIGALALALLTSNRRRPEANTLAVDGVRPTSAALGVALWFGVFALIALTAWTGFLPITRVGLGLVIAAGLSAIVLRSKKVAAADGLFRAPFVVGAHFVVILAALISWVDPGIRSMAGAAIVAVLVVVAQTVPKGARPVYLGVGYAYALVIFASTLDLAQVETIAVLCLTTTLASLCALAATLTRWLGIRSWYAVLIVTAVPFAIGIVSVLQVRSGWTALSTGVTFALALALLVTRRPGLTRFLRATAAALLVPALAVVVICLGAQMLAVSASPITLPIIAIIVACTLPSTGLIEVALVHRGLDEKDARVARIWIEISSLVTAVFAVLLALARAAAGIPTSFLVLMIIGIGSVATVIFARRQYAGVIAWASFTGALWCVWAFAGVDLVEPYLLPPALAAAVVGAVLTARGASGIGLPAVGLFATGLACAVMPPLAVLALSGSGVDATAPWRTLGLLAGALLLLLLGALIPRLSNLPAFRRIGSLRNPLLIIAIVAAAGGSVQAVRYGLGLDTMWVRDPQFAMLPVLVFSAAASLLAMIIAHLLPPSERYARWRYVPACLYLVVGPIAAVGPGWLPILTLLGFTLALLTLMLVTAARARTRPVTSPPVWFLFLLAWCTAVASWSERELRVEVFSLPLGLALLAAGIIAMRPAKTEPLPLRKPGWTSWPIGFTGSWKLLAPGILVTLGPSVLATGTDPRTERAILVIALALIAILVGSLMKLAAPFILGLIVLPIENVVVFTVQVGQSIGALPWWITLATAGAVLLVIAVTSEKRVAGDRGVAARLRDLT
jgi:hypothetical protein